MPTPYIVEITSKTAGLIPGSGCLYGKRNIIVAYGFDHKVSVPTGKNDDGSTGLRIHHPLTIYKEMDQASPILAQHLTSGGLLSSVTLRFFKKDSLGKEHNYHSIHLEKALVTRISPEMRLAFPEENEPFRHMEYVSFSYHTIRWVDEPNAKDVTDSTALFEDPESEITLAGAATVLATDIKEDFQVMFVDQDSKEIITGVKTKVTYPDGRFKEMLSSRAGEIVLTDMDKGAYTLSGFDPKPPQAWRGNTYALASMGQPSSKQISEFKLSGQKAEPGRNAAAFKHVCTIKEYDVKKGDRFSAVAQQHGLTFDELAFFNWGTKNKSDYLKHMTMRYECGDLAPSGDEYILEKGTIYIPSPINTPGLSTGVRHVAYVKKPGIRDLAVTVKTTSGHLIPQVVATLTLSDESIRTATSDKDGIALFTGIPKDLEGTITYEDEEDLLAKSFAANIKGSAEKTDVDAMLGLLQSAVDFMAVKKAYKLNYDADLGPSVLDAFDGHEDQDMIEILLLQNRLITSTYNTLYREGVRI